MGITWVTQTVKVDATQEPRLLSRLDDFVGFSASIVAFDATLYKDVASSLGTHSPKGEIMLEIGSVAPDFTAPINGGGALTLSEQRGKYVVLYFYPKDSTPGCTVEACNFRDNHDALAALGATVIGVSKDSVRRHDGFVKKQGLNFPLVSDADSDICERYGTWVQKKMYGKEYMGIARATYLIDPEGTIAHVWPKVSVKTHAADVLETLKERLG